MQRPFQDCETRARAVAGGTEAELARLTTPNLAAGAPFKRFVDFTHESVFRGLKRSSLAAPRLPARPRGNGLHPRSEDRRILVWDYNGG